MSIEEARRAFIVIHKISSSALLIEILPPSPLAESTNAVRGSARDKKKKGTKEGLGKGSLSSGTMNSILLNMNEPRKKIPWIKV